MTDFVRPFRALRPAKDRAADVVAPPYDVLSTDEARDSARGRPYSFLHISKPEIDLPNGTDPCAPDVYAKGAQNLRRFVQEEVLVRDDSECYYAYRLQMGEHIQTGIVCAASVTAYDSNRIRKHEFTIPTKEDDRVKHISAQNAQTSPVLLAYRASDAVEEVLEAVVADDPTYDLIAHDQVGHTIWHIEKPELMSCITDQFNQMDALYVADGHHRSAAASRVAASLGTKESLLQDDANHRYFLAVAFPDNEMQILDYNRVVRDLNGLTVQRLLDKVGERFVVTPRENAVRPSGPKQYGVYFRDAWYQLEIKDKYVPDDDPIGQLHVSILHDNLIEPLLGISDPRRDSRIDFVGGSRGLGELMRCVNNGEMAAAFSLFPTSMEALMKVADAGKVMPPKSTWFEPKLADGLISHVLD